MKKKMICLVMLLMLFTSILPHPLADEIIADFEFTYDGQPHPGPADTVPWSEYAGSEIFYKSADGNGYESSDPPVNAGNYTVTIAEMSDSGEYDTLIFEYSIGKATLIISADNKHVYEGYMPKELTYTVSGLIGDDKLIKTPDMFCAYNGVRRGKYAIIPNNAYAGENYTIEYLDGTLTVSYLPILHYMLGFETNGGAKLENVTYPAGFTVELSRYIPVREGYDFAGWYADAALTRQINEFTFDHNAIIYASWRAKPAIYECIRDNTCPAYHFHDLDLLAWYHDAVHFCTDKCIIYGVSNNAFAPDAKLTRAMLITILWRIEGSPSTQTDASFSDVRSGSYYDKAVAWAHENDITSGFGEGLFKPDSNVTREQMMCFLHRYAKHKGFNTTFEESSISFTDQNEISEWARESVRWATDTDLIAGTGSLLSPKAGASRSQGAQMLFKFCTKYNII